MAFPLYKILIVCFRYTSRPLNNTLIRTLKSRGKTSTFRTGFEAFGQKIHTWEIKLNRKIIKNEEDEQIGGNTDDKELKVFIKPLSPDAAFTKGVEYFSEIFFFYGMLLALAIYEINRHNNSSIKAAC